MMGHEISGSFEKKFFASSNSSAGFKSDYPLCFGETSGTDRLYIIKGGPGTGKSHFLRTIGRQAERVGYDTTYYYCSSDPLSLDGLKISENSKQSIGFIDGTAPHVWEPSLPGVKEEIINLGVFWNSDKLREKSGEIKALSLEKQQFYKYAYRYLAACGNVTAVTDNMVSSCVYHNKLASLAMRLMKSTNAGKCFTEIPGHLRCIGMTGCVYFDTYEKMSASKGGEIVLIETCYGLGYELTERLYCLSKQKKLHTVVSRDPIYPYKIDGLFYPENGLSFLVGDTQDVSMPCRQISLHRYIDAEKFRSIRGQVRNNIKQSENLKDCALHTLKKAGTAHFALEEIYASAMDFSAKEIFENTFCRNLFKS